MAYSNWSPLDSPTNSEESGYGSPAEVRNGNPFSPFQGLSQFDLASNQEVYIASRGRVQKNLGPVLNKLEEQEHISTQVSLEHVSSKSKTVMKIKKEPKESEHNLDEKICSIMEEIKKEPNEELRSIMEELKKEPNEELRSIMEELKKEPNEELRSIMEELKKEPNEELRSIMEELKKEPNEELRSIMEELKKEPNEELCSIMEEIKKEPKEIEYDVKLDLDEDICSISVTKPETIVSKKKEKASRGCSDQTFFPTSETKQKRNVTITKKKDHKHSISQVLPTVSKGQSKAHVLLKKEQEYSRSLSPAFVRTFSIQSRESVAVKTEEKEKDLKSFHKFDQQLPQLHDYKCSDSKKVIVDPSSSTSTPDGKVKVSHSQDVKKDEEGGSTGLWSRRYHPYYGHIRAATTSGVQRTLEPLKSRHHKRVGGTLQYAPYKEKKLTNTLHRPPMFGHTVSVHGFPHDPLLKVQNSPDTLPCRESTIQAKPQKDLHQHSDSCDKNVPNASIKDLFPQIAYVRPLQDSIAAHTLQEKEAQSGPSARKSERFSEATPKKESVAGLKYNTSHTKEGTPTSQGVKVRAPKTQPRCTTSLTKNKLPKQRTALATSTASKPTMNNTSGDSADTSDTNNAISPPQDPFATLKISPEARKLENLLKMQDIADDLKTVLRPELYRPDAPWKDSSLLMGLDKDLTFKVWVQKEFQGAISNAIKETLYKERKTKAPEYLTKLKVIGLKEAFKLQRDAAKSLLPGNKLYIKSNGKSVKLTAFFVGGTKVYAMSTTHEDDLTGDEVYYETGNKKISLGKIVSHISTGDPFREACLIEIHKEELKNVSEYITENPPRFISDIYSGELKHIPYIREQALMSSEPGCFNAIACKGVFDYMDGRNILKDAILWTSNGNAGGPGKSGSGIFALSENDVELVAMYIGRGRGAYKGCLISHGMKATIDFFSEQIGHTLQVFNVNTRPDVVEAANAASSAHTSNTPHVLQDSNAAYASAEHSDVPQPSLHASALVYAFQVGDGAPNAQISTAGSMSEVSEEEYAPQFINGLAVLQDGAAMNGDNNVEEGHADHENQSPNSYLRVISAREPLSRDARGGKIAKKRKATVKVMNTENGQRSFLKKARVESRPDQTDPNNRSFVFILD